MNEQLSSAPRMLNVVLRPGSGAHRAVAPPAPPPGGEPSSADLAAGFQPQPSWNLKYFGGKTIPNLSFLNRYVGGSAVWSTDDMTNIDNALSSAMSDAGLQSVMAQYFPGTTISSTMLPSAVHDAPVPKTVYKDTAEALASQLYTEHDVSDPGVTLINIMLPRGVVLSDDFSPGYTPPPGQESAHERRSKSVIKVDKDDAADSKNGLGGYHGSVHLAGGTTIYYAVGVYSEGRNGIPVFDEPWKNVVGTFYHELNEARTDADVEDVNSTGNNGLIGWYSDTGQGEIGDLPINEATDIHMVFQEVPLADGSGTVPVQLMWSNADGGPAASTSAGATATGVR